MGSARLWTVLGGLLRLSAAQTGLATAWAGRLACRGIQSPLMRVFFGDARYALVTLRRAPTFAATALTTLALGIGATTAVFAIVNAVLLRPLPYPESQQLVRLWEEQPGGSSPAGNRWLSQGTRAAWIHSSRTVENIGAYATYDYTVRIDDEPSRMSGAVVSPSVFAMLRATPAIGRFFTSGEDVEGAGPVAILSDQLWRQCYGSNVAITGKTIFIDGRLHTIVGVARPELRFPNPQVLFWMPDVFPTDGASPARMVVFTALGRLRAGATAVQAEAEGTAAARSVPRPSAAELFFGKGGPVVVHARTLVGDLTEPVRPALLLLVAAVALVLIIACANVANLLLSRGVGRHRELAIRAAIGAGPGRLVRQLLTESLVLSTGGGLMGLALAWALVRLLPLAAPAHLARLEDVRLDLTVVTVGITAALFAALASGLAPALRSRRVDLYHAFRGGDGSPSPSVNGPGGRGLRAALLMVEATFAVVLTVGASLLAHSFLRLTTVDAGYDPDHVVTLSVELPDGPGLSERTVRFIDGMLARVRRSPGVTSAGAGGMMPLMARTAITQVTLPPGVGAGKPTRGRALSNVITPGYAEALGLRLKEGRFFSETDAGAGTRAVLVNQEFVRRFLADDRVIGLQLGRLDQGEAGPDTAIIGVVGNVLKDGNDREPQPEIYFAHGSSTQRIGGYVNVLVRSSGGDDAALSVALRRYVREVDAGAVVDRLVPLRTLVASSYDQPRFATTVMSGFAALAMALAGVGLYGALSYSVSQRRREIGLRAALGASRPSIVRLVLREGFSVTVVGLGVGILVATLVTRLMRGLIFGVTPLDGAAFTLGPLLLVAVSVVACVVPAMRAASIDPAVALRGD
jgi:putative ABC transport system permease protein